ncbi:MAG: molybdopterin-dependent oxidoreductase, partial [Burkholderiales bacterium]|nr:molybdopterin-dependent oxidoreductase [Burkholderiales bacterium]
ADAIGLLASPHSTVEELYLAGALVRGIGSSSIDHRLRHAEHNPASGVRWLGRSIASLSTLDCALVVGSNLRKDHPLFAQRIRQAAKRGAKISVLNEQTTDWAIALQSVVNAPATEWINELSKIASAIATAKEVAAPVAVVPDATATSIAKALLGGSDKAILLGNAAAHHAHASALLGLANWIGQHTGATVGYLTEAANTVGAQLVNALPSGTGLTAKQMLVGAAKALFLLNVEPGLDTAGASAALTNVAKSQMVVTLSPFKTNLECSDVLLPIAPFSETAGSFVNAEGLLQSFHAVVKPLGDARPAWKVLRVLSNMLGVASLKQDAVPEVLAAALPGVVSGELVPAGKLSNAQPVVRVDGSQSTSPCTASIYQLDGLVRRSPSLQMTADARAAGVMNGVVA